MKLMTICVAILGLMGCGNYDLEKIAAGIKAKTGLPVTINTNETDECTEKQLNQMGRQLRIMRKAKRAELLDQVKASFTEISIEKTRISREVSGEITQLVFYEFHCSEATCWYEEGERKDIANGLERSGEEPRSRFESNDKVLRIQAEASYDKHTIVEYMTTNPGIYEEIEEMDSQLFRDAIEKKVVTLRNTIRRNGMTCNVNTNIFNELPLDDENEEGES